MNEAHEVRLKRLKVRSWRRGTREMDMILGPFWDAHGAELDLAALDQYEMLLSENDQDLYRWMSGQATPPAPLTPIVACVRAATASV